jgi:hypothetical protein
MRELRGAAITTLSGSLGMLAGAVAGVFDIPFNTTVMLGAAGAGFVLGPTIALRAAGLGLAEVTSGLAAVWVILLFLAFGPIIEVMGPAWLPIPFVVAALTIARLITEPLSRFLPEEETEPVPQGSGKPAWSWSAGR